MPIRLNLLAEERDLKREKLRDPQFLGYVTGGAICLFVTLYSLSVFISGQKLAHRVSELNKSWIQNEKLYKELKAMEEESMDSEAVIASLQRYATNRFVWAPVLNDLQFKLIPNIYLSSLRAEQALIFTPKKQNGNTVIPAQVEEKIKFHIKGFDISPETNLAVNEYKRNLMEGAHIKGIVARGGDIRISEVGTRRIDPIDPDVSYVEFTLLCQVADRIHK